MLFIQDSVIRIKDDTTEVKQAPLTWAMRFHDYT